MAAEARFMSRRPIRPGGAAPFTPAHSVAAVMARAVHAHGLGDRATAERLYGEVLSVAPHHAAAAYNLALLLAESGRERAAAARLAALLKRHPDDPAAHMTLGKLLLAEGNPARGHYHLRRAVDLDPTQREAWLSLIEAHGRAGQLERATEAADRAAAHFPTDPALRVQLAAAAVACGDRAAAVRAYEAALAHDPGFPPALFGLGVQRDDAGDSAAALALYRRAREAAPDYEAAIFNLAELQMRLGEVDAALANFDRSLAMCPGDPIALSARLMAEQYAPGVTAARLGRLHARWQQEVAAVIPRIQYQPPRPEAGRKLRLGLVSADLRSHPVGFFTIGTAEALDPADMELVVYATAPGEDALTRRFKARAAIWRDAWTMDDAALAAAIVRDRIDILADLGGHTRHARPGVFARRPAPLQFTWAGYVGTTGLAAMDLLIADRIEVPDGEDDAYTERVLRLPACYVTYDPPEAPDPAPLPAGMDRPLTFASFHNPPKINPRTVALWAAVLRDQPGSRIQFVYAGYDHQETRERIARWFAGHGIGPERLVFIGRTPHAALLSRYANEIDIALDPLPYSGGLTTLEALWMGVPVVTLAGDTFAGRHAASHVSNAGLPELVARDDAEFIAIIRRLGDDRAALATLRAGLRERVRASPLLDTKRFACDLSAALRAAWREKHGA